jgi:hypothetical protein
MAATPALPCMLSHARLKWYDRISLGDRMKMLKGAAEEAVAFAVQ